MKPVSFHRNEITFNPPEGSDDVAPLRALPVTYKTGETAIVSCWQLSPLELMRLFITRRVYVAVLSRQPLLLPPLMMTTELEEFGVSDR